SVLASRPSRIDKPKLAWCLALSDIRLLTSGATALASSKNSRHPPRPSMRFHLHLGGTQLPPRPLYVLAMSQAVSTSSHPTPPRYDQHLRKRITPLSH